jgi:O-antigen/teichoic acid export membrane protein
MRFEVRPIFKGIALTYITQAVVLVSFLFVFRLVARDFGPEGLGEYSLVKRATALLIPLLLLGLGMGIPRYIAISRDSKERAAYMQVTLVAVSVAGLFLLFMNLLKECFAKVFFGNSGYADLISPLSFHVAGFVLHSLAYSYLRGRLFVNAFNCLQAINVAVVPLMLLLFFRNITIIRLVTWSGFATCMFSLAFMLPFTKEFLVGVERSQFRSSSKDLLRYCIPRIPSSFALAGFFSIGPIIAAHFASAKEAGYLSVSQRLLNIVGTAVTPLGIILLPKVSSMISQERDEEIKQGLNYLVGAAIQLSIFVSFQLIILADIIVKYWLGPEFVDVIAIMRIASCSIFCYVFFRTVGSILDASKVKPINSINLFISLGIFLVISGMLLLVVRVFSPIISLSIAFASGLISLGILTHISIRKLHPQGLRQDLRCCIIAIGANIIIGGITVLVKPFIVSPPYRLVIFEILIIAIYLLILFLLKVDWLEKATETILRNTPDLNNVIKKPNQ